MDGTDVLEAFETSRAVVDSPILTIPSKLSLDTIETTIRELSPQKW